MSKIDFIEESSASPEIANIFNDIKTRLGTDHVPDAFKAIASHGPEILKQALLPFQQTEQLSGKEKTHLLSIASEVVQALSAKQAIGKVSAGEGGTDQPLGGSEIGALINRFSSYHGGAE